MIRRVDGAVAELARHPGALLVLSGGRGKRHPPEAPPEAVLMAGLAQARGVPPERLVLEAASGTTLDNARHTVGVIRDRLGWRRARLIIVTDATHLKRAVMCFRAVVRAQTPAARMEIVGVPVAGSGWRVRWGGALREAAARLLYGVRLRRPGALAVPERAGHDDHRSAPPGAG